LCYELVDLSIRSSIMRRKHLARETTSIPRTRQGVRDLDSLGGYVVPYSGESPGAEVNVSPVERGVSTLAGGVLAVFGLTRRNRYAGVGLAIAAGALLYRGLRGRCPVYGTLGISTAGRGRQESREEVVYRRK
jgi:uncharacterized membrane protein